MTTATQPFTGTYIVDPVHSTVGFAVKHMKVSLFRAWFTEIEARIVADEQGVEFVGTARVASVSIKAPQEFREHVLYGAEFFDGQNHPQITANATEIVFAEDGLLTVQGELTLRGVTRPVTATGRYQSPIEDPVGSTRAALEFTTTIDRRDWGMDWQMPLPGGGDTVGNLVELSANLELVKEA